MTEKIIAAFVEKYSETLGERPFVKNTFNVSGGCINNGIGILSDKGTFFIKWNSKSAYPEMFDTEKKGLELLAEHTNLTIPTPLFVGEDEKLAFLAMAYISGAGKQAHFWSDFGRRLAKLHRHTHSHFGLEYNNYIGSLPQSNSLHDTWTDFFINERLEKQIKKAFNDNLLEKKHLKMFENLYQRLPEIFSPEPPALIHGDLWSGNFMVDHAGLACLIDPAVYFGHREMDLAMSKLFGGFDRQFYASYLEEFPLEKNWHLRIEYCNLYPLLVHLNLFGKSYIGSIETCIKKFL